MTVIVDTREKPHAIKQILSYLDKAKVTVIRNKLYVGDYQLLENPLLVIDRKQNLSEVCSNCVQDHKRFTAELQRAKDIGVHVVILVEHSRNVKTLEDVRHWVNPRLKVSPMAVSGERLYKIMYAIQKHYDCEFLFCDKTQTGKRIIEILKEGAYGKDAV